MKQNKLLTSIKVLTLATVAGFTLTACQNTGFGQSIFNKKPVVQPKYQPDLVLGDVQTLTIDAARVPCQYTSLPMQCLMATTANNNVVEIPYNYINGFSPVKGMTYQINVRPFIDNNKQVQTGKWQLDSIVSQQVGTK